MKFSFTTPCQFDRRTEDWHEITNRCGPGWSLLGILQGSLTAQEWSSWNRSNNHDIQYRWLGSSQSESTHCHLQLRELERKIDTVVRIRIEYKYGDAEDSTRDVVTIMDPQGENMGERTVYRCVLVGDLYVTDIVWR